MSQNQYMHPRNIYRTPPDFKQLAIEFKEFRQISKMSINGTIQVDFKNDEALRTLNRCLLKKDFNLNIHFPPNKLMPAISLRLNYILWLEDIMTVAKVDRPTGVDIGCGASCIYAILASRKNNWTMIATDINDDSIKCAKQNIHQNELENAITVLKASACDDPLSVLSSEEQITDTQIDFTMCNPPFFEDDVMSSDSSEHDLNKNRSGKRPHPNNAKTGEKGELSTGGGEVAFVKKMIRNSQVLMEKVKICTTMLGHKSSLLAIETELKTTGVWNYSTTEFCQGRTTRWGIAWSFSDEFLLSTVPSYGHCSKRRKPLFKATGVTTVEAGLDKVCQILSDLPETTLSLRTLKDEFGYCILDAKKNAWSKQKYKKCMESALDEDGNEAQLGVTTEKQWASEECGSSFESAVSFLKATIIVRRKLNEQSKQFEIVIELQHLDGAAGNDRVYQLLQYITNKWS